jgi:hypothetical protein
MTTNWHKLAERRANTAWLSDLARRTMPTLEWLEAQVADDEGEDR